MANRLSVPNTRPANQEQHGRGLSAEKTLLPSFVIGRSLVTKKEIRDARNLNAKTKTTTEISSKTPKQKRSANKATNLENAVLEFRNRIASEPNNRKLGQVTTPEHLYIEYVPEVQMNEMLETYLKDTKGARRKEQRCNRAVSNIQRMLAEVQRQDGVVSNIDLGARTYRDSINEEEEDLAFPLVDPGPFQHWGVIPVGFEMQPELVGDDTIAIAVDKTPELQVDYCRLAYLLGDIGLDTRIMDIREWNPSVNVFKSFDDIKSHGTVDNIVIPSPPLHTPAQHFSIRSPRM